MSKCACKYYLNKMHLVCYCLNDGNIITGRDEVLEVPEAAEWHSYHCLECIVSFPVDWDCDLESKTTAHIIQTASTPSIIFHKAPHHTALLSNQEAVFHLITFAFY